MGILFDFVSGREDMNTINRFLRERVGMLNDDDVDTEESTMSVNCVTSYKNSPEEIENILQEFGGKVHPIRCKLSEGKKAFNLRGQMLPG